MGLSSPNQTHPKSTPLHRKTAGPSSVLSLTPSLPRSPSPQTQTLRAPPMSPAMIHSPASPGPVDPLDEDSETAAPADERAEEEDDATEEEEEEAEEDEDEEEEEQEEEEEAGTTRLAEGYYEIETIRRRRIHKGKLQYLIKWCGWPESTNTWEPYENLTACKDIVDAFEKRRKRKRMTLSSQGTSANPSHGKRALSSQGTSANPSHGKRGHPRRSDPRSLIRCPALEPKKLPLRSSSKRITNNSKKNSVARGLEALVNVVEQQIIGEMETQECGSCVVSAVCPYQGTPLSVEVNQPDDHGKSNGVSKAGNSKQAPPSQGGPMTRAKKRKCESVKRFIQNEATQEQGELQICRIEKPGHEDVDSTGGSGDRTKACTLYISFPPRPADEAVDGMEPIPAKPKKDAKEGGAPETGCKWKKKPQAPPQMKPPKKTEVSTAGASHVGTSAIDVSAAVNSATAASTPASSAPDVEAHEMEREQAPNPAREAEDKAATETPVVVTSSGDLFSALAEQALAAARVTHEAEGTPFPNAEMGSGCSPPSSYESREAWGRLAELVPWGSIELPQVVERGQVAIEAINAFVAAMPADLSSLLNLATEARTRAKAPLPETDPVLVAKDVEIAKLREELADQQERVKEAQAAQAAAELKVKDNAAQAAELDKLIKEARRLESEAVDFQEKIEATKQELERERKSNKVLRTNFDHLTKSKRTAKDRIRKLNLDVKDLERRLVASENAVTGLRAAAVVALGTMGASPLPALENTEGIISSLQTVSALRSATEGQAMLQAAKEAFVRVRLCFTLPLVEIAQRDPDEHDEEDVVEAKKLAEEPAEIIAALTASVLAGKGQ